MASRKKDEATSILNDVDDVSGASAEPIAAEVGEVKGLSFDVPEVPETGKSLYTMIASAIVGLFLTFAVSKGWIAAGEKGEYAPLLEGVIAAGMFFVAHRFLKSRSEVTVAKLAAASPTAKVGLIAGSPARFESAPLGASQPMGGFGLQGVLIALSSAQMVLGFLPGSTKKKAVVQKALAAAIAAITEFQKNPN